MAKVEDIIIALNKSHVSDKNGVSFAGKGLKLNNEQDAKEIIDAINECKDLEFLNLEGNTLGIEAARAISKALEKHGEFKKALWKDLFTGRMKTEIPEALQHLGNGLVISNARLSELDLSDNAFGPIGVKGLASLLKSSCCYALQVLKLNNNGLGIGGAKLLSDALMDCYNFSKIDGKPLSLKVFIAGRNRLENDGAKMLAGVFKAIGTLEEIQMPQNGIYHPGIAALSDAFSNNRNLEVLNLNDNTIGPKGAKSLAKIIPSLKNLRIINFGDCLLKSSGAISLSVGLSGVENLEELILDANEIRIDAVRELVKAVGDKKLLKTISLNGNQFGEDGVEEVKKLINSVGKANVLGSLSEDEGASDDEEDNNEGEEEEEQEEGDTSADISVDDVPVKNFEIATTTIEQFLISPTLENFGGLGPKRSDILIQATQSTTDVESIVDIFLKVTSLSPACSEPLKSSLLKTTDLICKEMFTWAKNQEKTSLLNNTLLVHLGLIKSEDKKFKPTCHLENCLALMHQLVEKNYIPASTKDTLKHFLKREMKCGKELQEIKAKLIEIINKY